MKTISARIILAILGGALIWQGILFVIQGNLAGLIAVVVGLGIVYKSRFW